MSILRCPVHSKYDGIQPPKHLLEEFPMSKRDRERGREPIVYYKRVRDCMCVEIHGVLSAVSTLVDRAYDIGRDNPRVNGSPFGGGGR